MKNGFVALVGAGPGEVSLLTVRAKELIEQAQVVLFDRLVSPEILALMPADAEKINVGKKSSHHLVPQDEINALLLQYGQTGKRIVRLKGGDPYVFGRGGEELELLVQHNIPFEVVPGITSAIAASSFAGIPVTHRDFCSSFHVITGHQKQNEPLQIDFESLVRTKGTLIFLMGVSSLTAITEGLLKAGMPADMPAAIVENGTRAYQRKVVATVSTLVEASAAQKMHSPSIIIVGKVCSLSTSFDWFSQRALFGKDIIVTSPTSSNGALARMLKTHGANVHAMPAVAIEQTASATEFASYIDALSQYTWLVFTSKNGVSMFFDALHAQKKDTRALAHLKIAAIGPSTAAVLAHYGITADYIPEKYQGQSLGEGLLTQVSKEDKLLFLRAEQGNDALVNCIAQGNIPYTDHKIYRTKALVCYEEALSTLQGTDCIVCFTSASTVDSFMQNKPDIAHIKAICIGEQTAQAAQKYQLSYVIADRATLESMVQKVLEVAQ